MLCGINGLNYFIDLLLDGIEFVLTSIGSKLLLFDNNQIKMERKPEKKIQKVNPAVYTGDGDDDDCP